MRIQRGITFAVAVSVLAFAAMQSLSKDVVRFNVKAFGAKGDGSAKDTAAIQRAIDAASMAGGGQVVFPPGKYVSGSIYIKGNVELRIDKGAVLFASPDKADYNTVDICPQNRASGKESSSGAHLILSIGKKNVAITGEGKIDGNCDAFLLDPNGRPWSGGERGIPWRPSQMLYFVECANVCVEGVSLVDSPYWSCFFHGCTNVVARNLHIRTKREPYHAYNGDGIDIDCCEDVDVSGCDINTADDSITFRASGKRLKKPRQCARVRVSGCSLSSACNAFRLGVGNGTVRDVTVCDVKIRDTRTAVDIVSSWKRGGKGVVFSNIDFDGMDVESTMFCRIYPRFAKETHIDDIRFANVSGRVECASWITGRSDSPVGRVEFDNVRLPHGVVCFHAPKVKVSGGEFASREPAAAEKRVYDREIKDHDEFPCVFTGPLYDSIQSRRMKFK